jgi:hypothetical protein
MLNCIEVIDATAKHVAYILLFELKLQHTRSWHYCRVMTPDFPMTTAVSATSPEPQARYQLKQ